MGWIVGIVAEQGGLRVVEKTEGGERTAPLSQVPLGLSKHVEEFRKGSFIELDLCDLEACSDDVAFDRLGIPEAVRRCQTIFRYRRGRTTHYIPSQVLIGGLACPNRLTRSFLLSAAGYEMLAMLVEGDEGTVAVEVARGVQRKKEDLSLPLFQALVWTACYPSAKRMVASVFNHALTGRFDLSLPLARVSMSLPGSRVGTELLVQELSVEWVRPKEQPFLGLVGRAPENIVFRRRGIGCGAERGERRRPPSKDPSLQLGSGGWTLSDNEWLVVEAILMSTISPRGMSARGLGQDPRRKVELLLRKQSEGIPWRKMGDGNVAASNVVTFFGGIRRDGRWERIKQFLEESRTKT